MQAMTNRPNTHRGPGAARSGMTLIEVVISMALLVAVAGGLYAVGIKSRQMAEHTRLVTEARSLAKERLEELYAIGMQGIQSPSCDLLEEDTTTSSLGYPLVRATEIAWHNATGGVVSVSAAAYAEARVKVTYSTPMYKENPVSDYYTLIISQ